MTADLLDLLVAEILASAKYHSVEPGLVRAIGARELAAHGRLKEAIKATKSKLHQIAGSYLDGRPEYAAWLAELAMARGDPDALLIVEFAEEDHTDNLQKLKQLSEMMTDLGFGWSRPRRKWGGVIDVIEPAMQTAVAKVDHPRLHSTGRPVSLY